MTLNVKLRNMDLSGVTGHSRSDMVSFNIQKLNSECSGVTLGWGEWGELETGTRLMEGCSNPGKRKWRCWSHWERILITGILRVQEQNEITHAALRLGPSRDKERESTGLSEKPSGITAQRVGGIKRKTVRICSEESGCKETWKRKKLVKERAEGRQHLRAQGQEEGGGREQAETAVRFLAALKLSLPLGRSQFRCPRSKSQVLFLIHSTAQIGEIHGPKDSLANISSTLRGVLSSQSCVY